jgi:hypothetical protein
MESSIPATRARLLLSGERSSALVAAADDERSVELRREHGPEAARWRRTGDRPVKSRDVITAR